MPAAIVPARDLARHTDVQLLESYCQDHEVAVRDELVRRFMPFARTLAIRYLHSREPLDDLIQVAYLGLLNAIERFEPGRGKSFTAYAAPTILGELKRHFRDKSWSLHVPRELKDRALASSRHRERLYVQLGRCPTVDELANALRCTIPETIEALGAADNYHPQSLDAAGGDDDEERMPLLELLGGFDDGFGLAEDRQSLAARWRTLSEAERQIVGLRLLHGLTQREISQHVGCSQMHVSRLLSRSILRLSTPDGSAPPALAFSSPSARQVPSAMSAPRVLESLATGGRSRGRRRVSTDSGG
jgi:RNA polymerase sigma-B factor